MSADQLSHLLSSLRLITLQQDILTYCWWLLNSINVVQELLNIDKIQLILKMFFLFLLNTTYQSGLILILINLICDDIMYHLIQLNQKCRDSDKNIIIWLYIMFIEFHVITQTLINNQLSQTVFNDLMKLKMIFELNTVKYIHNFYQ